MDYQKTGAEILRLVGGKENVATVTHCMTRLRFTLKDRKLAQVEELKKLSGVQGVVTKNGQFQIVIGTDVGNLCDAIQKMGNFKDDAAAEQQGEKSDNIIMRFFGTLTAIFQPVIPALAGSGMIKALLALLVATHVISNGSQTYAIFYAFGDALFSFMPFILAYSAAKHFACNPYISATLAGVLLHASFTALNTGDPVRLFGFIPVTMVSYGGSVVPILLIVWVQSKIEPWANKISPKAVKIFLAPMITIIGTGIIGVVIAGPLGNLVGQVLAVGFNWLNDYAGWVIPMLMGALCPFFVMTGMHYCFAPIQTIQYATLGYGTILGPGMLASNIAQGTASLMVGLRTKNKNLKELSLSSGFTALMGITEPALYGVNLKLKKPLYAAVIGGGVAGLFAGLTHLHTYSSTTAGLLALPVYIGGDGFGNVINAVITIIISMVVTAIATIVIGFDDPVEESSEPAAPVQEAVPASTEQGGKIVIASPVKGEVVALESVKDEAFSSHVLGQGAAVIPAEGRICAPVDAVVESVADAGHAIGLHTADGADLLIHIGMDTVELGGKGFDVKVKTGDAVKKGQELIAFDLDAIKKAGYETVTPIVVTNPDDFLDVVSAKSGAVAAGDTLITVLKRG